MRKIESLKDIQGFIYDIPRGLMARILGFHPRGPGSIPGVGEPLFDDAMLQCLTAGQES